jgi:HEAT repeat protein
VGLIAKYRNFQKNRQDKAVAKNAALVTNSKAGREERVAAIDYLVSLTDVAIAVPALLRRFEFSLEHGINDTREKEAVMEGIAAFGASAIPFIVEHLRATTRIAWSIKTFKKIADDEQIRDALITCLDFSDITLDQQKVDKNYDILCYLHEFQLPIAATRQIFAFLTNLDERVRFAAVEVLVEQKSAADEIAQHLVQFLDDLSPENSRIHQAVVTAYKKVN